MRVFRFAPSFLLRDALNVCERLGYVVAVVAASRSVALYTDVKCLGYFVVVFLVVVAEGWEVMEIH